MHPLFLYNENKLVVFYYFSMHILTTSTESQSLSIVARVDASSPTFELTDKMRNKTETISVTKTSSDPFMVLSGAFSLVENRMYSFKVKDGSNVIYKGLIFCTDQTEPDKFFVHEGEYIEEQSYDNEFVIL